MPKIKRTSDEAFARLVETTNKLFGPADSAKVSIRPITSGSLFGHECPDGFVDNASEADFFDTDEDKYEYLPEKAFSHTDNFTTPASPELIIKRTKFDQALKITQECFRELDNTETSISVPQIISGSLFNSHSSTDSSNLWETDSSDNSPIEESPLTHERLPAASHTNPFATP